MTTTKNDNYYSVKHIIDYYKAIQTKINKPVFKTECLLNTQTDLISFPIIPHLHNINDINQNYPEKLLVKQKRLQTETLWWYLKEKKLFGPYKGYVINGLFKKKLFDSNTLIRSNKTYLKSLRQMIENNEITFFKKNPSIDQLDAHDNEINNTVTSDEEKNDNKLIKKSEKNDKNNKNDSNYQKENNKITKINIKNQKNDQISIKNDKLILNKPEINIKNQKNDQIQNDVNLLTKEVTNLSLTNENIINLNEINQFYYNNDISTELKKPLNPFSEKELIKRPNIIEGKWKKDKNEPKLNIEDIIAQEKAKKEKEDRIREEKRLKERQRIKEIELKTKKCGGNDWLLNKRTKKTVSNNTNPNNNNNKKRIVKSKKDKIKINYFNNENKRSFGKNKNNKNNKNNKKLIHSGTMAEQIKRTNSNSMNKKFNKERNNPKKHISNKIVNKNNQKRTKKAPKNLNKKAPNKLDPKETEYNSDESLIKIYNNVKMNKKMSNWCFNELKEAVCLKNKKQIGFLEFVIKIINPEKVIVYIEEYYGKGEKIKKFALDFIKKRNSHFFGNENKLMKEIDK